MLPDFVASRPARARGLKRVVHERGVAVIAVAPRAGAWIETTGIDGVGVCLKVAPRAGAWIETTYNGLCQDCADVAPRAGAWIETNVPRRDRQTPAGRAPRGRVD